jgi:hypothetical protein
MTMNRIKTMIGAAIAVGVSVTLAAAADWGTGGVTPGRPIIGVGGPYGYDYDRATTPVQGWAYGLASIIRAEGQFNYDTSVAALNLSEVQRREMESWQKWTETYFEVRRMNRELRAAERGRLPTEADFIRYAQIGKPRRLGPSDLDVITGSISWPILLRSSDFAANRSTLEQIFAQRASSGVIGTPEYLQVYDLTAMMMDDLRQRIREVPPNDYVNARRFLESLAYEARMPAI